MLKRSIKRAKEERTYKKICDEIDREAKSNDEWVCFFCGLPLGNRADHHHLKGRDGDLLTNKDFIVLGHNNCHVWQYHQLPKSELMKLWWYDQFKIRLDEKIGVQEV